VLAGTDLLVGVARHEGLAFLRHSDVDDDSDDDSAGRDRWRKALRTFVQVYTSWHTIAPLHCLVGQKFFYISIIIHPD